MAISEDKHAHQRLPHVSVIVVSMVLLMSNACSSSTGSAQTQHPTPTASTPASYQSTQWKVAYLDQTAHMHAIGLDGAQDQQLITLTDPILSDPQRAHSGFFIDALNPDGHTLSYGQTTMHLVDIRQQTPDHSADTHAVISGGAWSPDGKQEIVTDGANNFYVLQTSNVSFRPLTGNPYPERDLLGWLDATHIVVGQGLAQANPNDPNADGYALDSIDIGSGTHHRLASLMTPHLGVPMGKLAPDHQHVLFYNAPWQDEPFTPLVGIFDLHTGALRQLPAITNQTKSYFTSVAWAANGQMAIATTGFLENSNLQAWMLHLGADMAVKTKPSGYVYAWNAQTNTILASTALGTSLQDGPYTITAMQVQPADTFKTTILTTKAYSTPVIGFIPPTTS